MNMEAQRVRRDGFATANRAAGPDASAAPSAATALSRLLEAESLARRAVSLRDVEQVIVNETRALLRGRQSILLDRSSGAWRVTAVSNVAKVDRAGPLPHWIESIAANLERQTDIDTPQEFALPAYADPEVSLTREYPFRHVLWLPLWSPRATGRHAAIIMRERPWLDVDRKIGARLSESFGHARAFCAIEKRPLATLVASPWRKSLLAISILLLAGVWPVSLSVLAPVEVVPRDADVVAMPVDGIVEKVLVRPSENVEKNQPLVKLVDTIPRNKVDVAAREVAVAEARVERASSLAFTDPRGRQELGIARAELQLKLAEHAYARELLESVVIRAPAAGVALYSDPKDLQGKPASTGQKLMLVARPGATDLRISVPVSDSIVLRRGLPVRAFLDTDPLNPVEGEITSVDHQAKLSDGAVASYQVVARPADAALDLTLGSHGTAQVRGPRTPLALYLLRRPINTLRQWAGL